MEYILEGIPGKEAGQERAVSSILHLREKLIKTGYNAEEVDYMITVKSGHKDLVRLDWATLKEIEEALAHQLKIAQKCIDLVMP